MNFHLAIEEAKAQLNKVTDPFVLLMKHGTMQVEYFSPKKEDTQTPHKQDELYIIATGSSLFYRDEEIIKCKQGDVLFVPAGTQHRFKNFSDDFATWVNFLWQRRR